MRVCKFGGTCVTDINISKIASIVDCSCPVVVVSAIGAQHANDSKVTQLLVQLNSMLPDISIWQIVADKYRQLVRRHHIDINIEGILQDTIANIVLHNSYHYTISVGEQLSAMVMARYLGRQYIECADVVLFDNSGSLLVEETYSRIANTVLDGQYYVMGGFYGSRVDGQRITFSRGGSDITGALVASALNADIYENWTDVCGVCHCDPRLVDCVGSVRCLSYDNMQLLAQYGVAVLNEHSIYPARDAGIPINIRSIYNIADSGTMVCNSDYSNQILSIVQHADGQGYVTTIISTYVAEYIMDSIDICMRRVSVPYRWLYSGGNIVSIATAQSVIAPLYRQLVD